MLVPSRGRPDNIRRLVAAFDETCTADTRLIVGLDMDDPQLLEYLDVIPMHVHPVVLSDLRQVVAWTNRLAAGFGDEAHNLGMIGDDNVPRTKGWDTRVCESLVNHNFCFGDDLNPGRPAGSLCCHVFMRSEVVYQLGYAGPPSLRHMYVDDVWMAWGQATSIEFLSDVVIEHLHPSAEKATDDAVYEASLACVDEDARAFHAYCRDGLGRDIRRLGG